MAVHDLLELAEIGLVGRSASTPATHTVIWAPGITTSPCYRSQAWLTQIEETDVAIGRTFHTDGIARMVN